MIVSCAYVFFIIKTPHTTTKTHKNIAERKRERRAVRNQLNIWRWKRCSMQRKPFDEKRKEEFLESKKEWKQECVTIDPNT